MSEPCPSPGPGDHRTTAWRNARGLWAPGRRLLGGGAGGTPRTGQGEGGPAALAGPGEGRFQQCLPPTKEWLSPRDSSPHLTPPYLTPPPSRATAPGYLASQVPFPKIGPTHSRSSIKGLVQECVSGGGVAKGEGGFRGP